MTRFGTDESNMEESDHRERPSDDGGCYHCGDAFHRVFRWCDWFSFVLCTSCFCPGSHNALCTMGKQDISPGLRTMLMCSAIIQCALLVSIATSLYTSALLSAEDSLRTTMLWYEIPSAVSICYCLWMFIRGVLWNESIALVYAVLEVIKVLADAFVMVHWYLDLRDPSLSQETRLHSHILLLIVLLGLSALLSLANIWVLYAAYRHWCTSQTKADALEEVFIDTENPSTVAESNQDSATDNVVAAEEPTGSRPQKRTTRTKRTKPNARSIQTSSTYRPPDPTISIDLSRFIEDTRRTSQLPPDIPPVPAPRANPPSKYDGEIAYFS